MAPKIEMVVECLKKKDYTTITTYLTDEVVKLEEMSREEKLKTISTVVELFRESKRAVEALEMVNQLYDLDSDVRVPLLEYRLQFYYENGDKNVVVQIMDELDKVGDDMVWLPETSHILASACFARHDYSEGIQLLQNALALLSAPDEIKMWKLVFEDLIVNAKEKAKDLNDKRKKAAKKARQAQNKKGEEEVEKDIGAEKKKEARQTENIKNKKGKEKVEEDIGVEKNQKAEEDIRVEKNKEAEGKNDLKGEKKKEKEVKKDLTYEEMLEYDADCKQKENLEEGNVKGEGQEAAEEEVDKKAEKEVVLKEKKKGKYSLWSKAAKKKEEEKENEKEEKKENENLEEGNVKGEETTSDDNKEEEKENGNLEEEVKESTSEDPPQFEEYEVSMRLIRRRVCDHITGKSYVGFIKTNGVLLEKTFIEAQPRQVEKSKELVSLTSKHPSLLRVENVVLGYVITEPVYQVETFFLLKLQALSPQPKTNKEWWEKICDIFWQIFRDVLRGLMFLFDQSLSCGDVSFNVYVTQDERGRILPSMKQKHSPFVDLRDLTQIMKELTKLSCPLDVGDSHIPDDLEAFFVLIRETKSRWKNVPVLFLADYPYFLNVMEKVDFMKKTRDLFKKRRPSLPLINRVMGNLKCCNDWTDKPKGAYKEVFKFPDKKGKSYKTNDDVVRYCGAVLTHVNDPNYDAFRVKEYLNNDEIERDLLLYFPDYYRGIVRSLCECVENGILSPDDLMEVCTVYYKQS